MGFPAVKVVGQEPNIHELLFLLRNLVLRICPPGTAISLYKGSTNSSQLHESHVTFFLNIYTQLFAAHAIYVLPF